MANAEQLQYVLIDEWHDCYINEYKQRGYVATLDLSKIKYDYAYTRYWGLNDKPQLIALTDGSTKPLTNVFLSLNAFNGKHRRANTITQLRNVGIDLDCYKLGLTAEEAAKKLQALVYVGRVPNPNLLIRSGNGLQLVYGIAGGLPPTNEMKWIVSYITNELATLLQPLGADFAANTLERVFRLPGTYNAKPGKEKKLVTAEVWNREEHTINSLMEYCTPYLPSNKPVQPRKPKGELKYLDFTKTQGMTTRTLNTARMNDMLRLVRLRNGAIEARNVFTYDYAFMMALMTKDEGAVLTAAFQINDLFDDPQTSKIVERTARNAYKDGRAFWDAFVKNEYSVKGLPRDLVKPKQTRTLIKQHSITLDEQQELSTLISKEVRDERQREAITDKRRAQGVRPMSEYNENRSLLVSSLEAKVANLLTAGLKQKQIAAELNLTAARVSQIVKGIREKS